MVNILKPSDEIVVGATSIALVLAIFATNAPNLADVRADQPGNMNSYKSANLATITSVAAVGALAILGKSPTVFTIGGAAILFEAWKHHFANFGANGTAENQAASQVG